MGMFDKLKGMMSARPSDAATSPVTRLVTEARFEARRGALQKATELYQEAIRKEPTFADAHRGLAEICLLQGKEDEALASFQKAVRLEPSMQDAHYQIGRIYLGRREMAKATAAFEMELAVTPRYGRVHNDLAVAYFQQKNYAKAIQHADQALAIGEPVHAAFLKVLEPYRR